MNHRQVHNHTSSSSDRLREMIDRYQVGEPLDKIGDRFGITRQRVHQILQKAGVPKWKDEGVSPRVQAAITAHGWTLVALQTIETRPRKRYLLRCAADHEVHRIASRLDNPCQQCLRDQREASFIGRRFTRWVIIERGQKRRSWRCRCICGTIADVPETNLTLGYSHGCHTCGIAARERRKLIRKLGFTAVRLIYKKAVRHRYKPVPRRIRYAASIKSCGRVTQIYGKRPVNGWDRKQGGLRKAR